MTLFQIGVPIIFLPLFPHGTQGNAMVFKFVFLGTEFIFFQTHSYPEFQICKKDANGATLLQSAVCEAKVRVQPAWPFHSPNSSSCSSLQEF